jgi:hypothetical protein
MSTHYPIAFTYEADVHCPACTFARFGREPDRVVPGRTWPWPPDDATDREGNPIGSIAPWDDWCNGKDEQLCRLACGDCREIIDTHTHGLDALVASAREA